MALHVVVHHASTPSRRYRNRWLGDLIVSITTPPKVATELRLAKERGERVYVHRCASGSSPAVIACSGLVGTMTRDVGGDWEVTFVDVAALLRPPLNAAYPGLNIYMAPAPD